MLVSGKFGMRVCDASTLHKEDHVDRHQKEKEESSYESITLARWLGGWVTWVIVSRDSMKVEKIQRREA